MNSFKVIKHEDNRHAYFEIPLAPVRRTDAALVISGSSRMGDRVVYLTPNDFAHWGSSLVSQGTVPTMPVALETINHSSIDWIFDLPSFDGVLCRNPGSRLMELQVNLELKHLKVNLSKHEKVEFMTLSHSKTVTVLRRNMFDELREAVLSWEAEYRKGSAGERFVFLEAKIASLYHATDDGRWVPLTTPVKQRLVKCQDLPNGDVLYRLAAQEQPSGATIRYVAAAKQSDRNPALYHVDGDFRPIRPYGRNEHIWPELVNDQAIDEVNQAVSLFRKQFHSIVPQGDTTKFMGKDQVNCSTFEFEVFVAEALRTFYAKNKTLKVDFNDFLHAAANDYLVQIEKAKKTA